MIMEIVQKEIMKGDNSDLRNIFSIIWKGKFLIVAMTIFFAAVGTFFAMRLPDVYISEATLAPSENNGLKVPGQLGGLAALAGVDLGGMNNTDKSLLAIEILKSRDFIGRFIDSNDLYVPIMAAKGWDRNSNTLIIDSEIYDEKKAIWVRDVEKPFKPKPSRIETIEEFKKLISVNQDKSSGMIKLSIEFYSPVMAKNWIDIIVRDVNEEMRNRDLVEAEKSIEYLETQITETNLSDVRKLIFSLIEEQVKTIMLASVRKEYVLKTIDPAVIAERKSKPKRLIIVISSIFLGFSLSILLLLASVFLGLKKIN
jgi:uncharacterized protein involved in exopolysaccharide biosynthesis